MLVATHACRYAVYVPCVYSMVLIKSIVSLHNQADLRRVLRDVYEYHGVTHLGYFIIYFSLSLMILFMVSLLDSPRLHSFMLMQTVYMPLSYATSSYIIYSR